MSHHPKCDECGSDIEIVMDINGKYHGDKFYQTVCRTCISLGWIKVFTKPFTPYEHLIEEIDRSD